MVQNTRRKANSIPKDRGSTIILKGISRRRRRRRKSERHRETVNQSVCDRTLPFSKSTGLFTFIEFSREYIENV